MNQKGILKLLLTCSSDFKKLYDKIITELSSAVSVSANDASTDEFYNIERDCTPSEKTKVQTLLSQYCNALEGLIKQGITRAVLLCADTQDKALKSYTRMEGDEVDAWRKDTAKAFVQSRMKRDKGLNLSDRVWNYTQQTKSEFELAMSHSLEDGISKGISAESLGRRVKQYLNNPDMMYRRYHTKKLMSDGTKKDVVEWRRRVIGEDGKVHFVKEDLAKVGTGVYRSARQNALRLTITETNMAYDFANCIRWANEPFVLGLRIRLSEAHPEDDICDELEGDYPKTFMWRGWHPRCMCSISPILMDRKSEEWKKLRAMSDEDYKKYQSPNLIKSVPNKFEKWCDTNKDKLNAAREKGKLPYFVRDNEKVVGELVGWKTKKELIMEAAKARHDARTPEKETQLREYWAKKVAEGDARRHKEAILEAAKKRQDARTQEQKDDIQARWNKHIQKVELMEKTADNVLSVAEKYSNKIDYSTLQNAISNHNLDNMLSEAKKIAKKIAKVQAKEFETRISDLIPNAHGWAKKFSRKELEAVHKTVENKLAQWKNLPLDKQLAKLKFEFQNYLEGNMNNVQSKYKTWEVARDAYKKAYNEKLELTELAKKLAEAKQYTIKGKWYDKYLLQLEDSLNAQDLASAKKVEKKIQKKIDEARKNGTLVEDAYSKTRKDNAMWAQDTKEADDALRAKCGEVWRNATQDERDAIFGYTYEFCNINEPLRGMTFIGTKEKAERGLKRIPLIEDIINKSEYDFDMWLQRGDGMVSLKKFGLSNYLSATDDEIMALVGKEGTEGAFWSSGVAKGKGFSGKVIFNIYAPKGTKMMYCEPFSQFGNGSGHSWDGFAKQTNFGQESEILIQRGTTFRITKIEKGAKCWYIDVDVIEQKPLPFPYKNGFPYK